MLLATWTSATFIGNTPTTSTNIRSQLQLYLIVQTISYAVAANTASAAVATAATTAAATIAATATAASC